MGKALSMASVALLAGCFHKQGSVENSVTTAITPNSDLVCHYEEHGAEIDKFKGPCSERPNLLEGLDEGELDGIIAGLNALANKAASELKLSPEGPVGLADNRLDLLVVRVSLPEAWEVFREQSGMKDAMLCGVSMPELYERVEAKISDGTALGETGNDCQRTFENFYTNFCMGDAGKTDSESEILGCYQDHLSLVEGFYLTSKKQTTETIYERFSDSDKDPLVLQINCTQSVGGRMEDLTTNHFRRVMRAAFHSSQLVFPESYIEGVLVSELKTQVGSSLSK